MDVNQPYPLEKIGEAYTALRKKEKIKALINIKG
jgi:hypothetical protein